MVTSCQQLGPAGDGINFHSSFFLLRKRSNDEKNERLLFIKEIIMSKNRKVPNNYMTAGEIFQDPPRLPPPSPPLVICLIYVDPTSLHLLLAISVTKQRYCVNSQHRRERWKWRKISVYGWMVNENWWTYSYIELGFFWLGGGSWFTENPYSSAKLLTDFTYSKTNPYSPKTVSSIGLW